MTPQEVAAYISTCENCFSERAGNERRMTMKPEQLDLVEPSKKVRKEPKHAARR